MLQSIHRGQRIGYRLLLGSALLALIVSDSASAQTTVFTYQGKLNDNGNPASGPYDFQFKLFDTAVVGTGMQQGSTLSRSNVQVTAGIFTVQLDFGGAVFPGTERYLEISVRPAGGGAFTMLAPRQAVTSTPYALRSTTAGTAETATNATQLGGLTADGFIQNTTSQQAATSFNIGGTGTASVLNAVTQFNLGGSRILSNAGSDNLFVGINTGPNSTGGGNAFFGAFAGQSNTSGFSNSFFGASAGLNNTTGPQNSFFGLFSGLSNTTGGNNAFFGSSSGAGNTTGQQNAFFGAGAGSSNTTGKHNSFFGQASANQNTTGDDNSFFGWFAGLNNQAGILNTFIGEHSGFDSTNTTGNGNTLLGGETTLPPGVSNSTAIGFGARVTQSNSLVLGNNVNVGIGTNAPGAKLQVSTTALDQHVYLSSAAPSLALGNSDTRSSATMNSLFALATSEGHFGVPAGGLTIANYGNARGNIYIDSNYSGAGVTNVILQPFGGNVGIGTLNPIQGKLHVEAGSSSNSVGVYGNSSGFLGTGVYGNASGPFGAGVSAISDSGNGVDGSSTSGIGVRGLSTSGDLLVGQNPTGIKFRVANNGNVHAPAYQALPDFAEEILPRPADKSRLEPGDVLIAAPDTDRSVTRSRKPYSTSVLGVYSTAPGFIGTEHPIAGASSETIPMAVIGIVPCKVSAENGPIRRGDLLTTSRTPGHAMRCANHRRCSGAIVGKALAAWDRGRGVIRVLVSLQ